MRGEDKLIGEETGEELDQGTYIPTDDELRGIDRGLRDAADGKFATDEDVEAVFAKHRSRKPS